jgi:hypothetical protein
MLRLGEKRTKAMRLAGYEARKLEGKEGWEAMRLKR